VTTTNPTQRYHCHARQQQQQQQQQQSKHALLLLAMVSKVEETIAQLPRLDTKPTFHWGHEGIPYLYDFAPQPATAD
jgi:hypothetical protein